MANATRTFLAVAVPESLELRLTRLQSQLAGEVPEGRWVVTRPFHVTLAFLGDVDVSDLNAVCVATAETAAPFGRLEIELRGLGAFPTPARPRVVWTGVGGPGLERARTTSRPTSPARPPGVGYPPDDDARFTPTSPSAGSSPAGAAVPRPHPAAQPLPDLVRRLVHRRRGRHLRLDPSPAKAPSTPLSAAPRSAGRKPGRIDLTSAAIRVVD